MFAQTPNASDSHNCIYSVLLKYTHMGSCTIEDSNSTGGDGASTDEGEDFYLAAYAAV